MTTQPSDDHDIRRILVLVVIVAAVVAGVGAAMLTGRDISKVHPAARLIALFPLEAEDGDTALARLGRDVAAAAALALRTVPDVGAADPAAVVALAGAHELDHERADSLARRLGATSYVFGEIERAGGRYRAELSLRSTARGGPAAEMVAGGPADDPALLADSVTWAILGRLYRGHNMPRPRAPLP